MMRENLPHDKRCTAQTNRGTRCNSPRLVTGDQCFVHSPETRDEAQRARELGGRNRRRESVIGITHAFSGFTELAEVIRVLEIAVYATLELENSIQRNRTLIYAAGVAERTLMSMAIERLAAEVMRRY